MFTRAQLDIDTRDIVDKVFKLRPYWIQRLEAPFYTLGRCAYLDGKTPEYKQEIQELNPILLDQFQDLYGKTIAYMSTLVGEDIELDDFLAHPSFHIAKADPCFLEQGGKWHIDIPHETLNLGTQDPLTFTTAILLPTGGAGIDYINEEGMQGYLEYEEKGIIVHDGSIPHRIAPLKAYVPNDYRITMQGHLIRINGRLKMFW